MLQDKDFGKMLGFKFLIMGYFGPIIFLKYSPPQVDPATGLIDYAGLEASANLFKPKMIVAGISCYSRKLDYARCSNTRSLLHSLLSLLFVPPLLPLLPLLPFPPLLRQLLLHLHLSLSSPWSTN